MKGRFAAVALALALAGGAAAGWLRGARPPSGATPLSLAIQSPGSVRAAGLVLAARAALRERLPADTATAERLLAASLRRDPRNADAWLLLAEARMMAGAPEQALAALEEAERLAPGNPNGMAEAARLRALAGQQERAVAALQRVADLDEAGAIDAGRTLRNIGRPPEEIAAVILRARRDSQSRARIVLALLGSDGGWNDRLLRACFAAPLLESEPVRQRLAQAALRPFAPGALRAIAQAQFPNESFPDGEPVLPGLRPLRVPGLEDRFPLGWVIAAGDIGWIDDVEGDALRIRAGARQTVSVALYRGILPPGGEGTARATIRAGEGTAVRLVVAGGGRSEAVSPGTEAVLAATIPSADLERPVTVLLEIVPSGNLRGAAELSVRDLRFELP